MQQPADGVVRPAIKHVPRSVVCDAHERIVRCGLGIVPVSSETEDKFEDAMEVTPSSPLLEIARVLVRVDRVARFIVNAIGNSGRRARSNNGKFRIFPGVGQRENRCKNEYLLATATTRLELGLKNP
jgi:hypothetical protein